MEYPFKRAFVVEHFENKQSLRMQTIQLLNYLKEDVSHYCDPQLKMGEN